MAVSHPKRCQKLDRAITIVVYKTMDREAERYVMRKVVIQSPSYGIGQFPVTGICSANRLPAEASLGLEADWSSANFISISQIVAIATVQLCGKSTNRRPIILPPQSSIDGYLSRMNYYSVLGIDHQERFTRHDPQDRFVPLTSIPIDEYAADPNSIGSMLRRVIASNVCMSKSVTDYLDLSFGEMIDNIVQHSQTKSPGIAGAQYHPQGGYVEACVADCGIGIAASMARNPKYASRSDNELVTLAFEAKTGEWFGCSEVGTNKVSGGMGLAFAARLAKVTEGHVWTVTRGSAIHVSSNGTETMDGLYYPGTLIVMRIPETEKEIFDSDMHDGGESKPARWDPANGRYVESNPLW